MYIYSDSIVLRVQDAQTVKASLHQGKIKESYQEFLEVVPDGLKPSPWICVMPFFEPETTGVSLVAPRCNFSGAAK